MFLAGSSLASPPLNGGGGMAELSLVTFPPAARVDLDRKPGQASPLESKAGNGVYIENEG